MLFFITITNHMLVVHITVEENCTKKCIGIFKIKIFKNL